MQPKTTALPNKEQFIILIACLCLFMGIGRIFSLVTHNPVLGYANNYDMIRLQACHQIWPADKFTDITIGTPSAPIRRYTLDKHVDTPCFPSSELLFTSIGIELAKLKNHFTGETLISIKTIGLVKAVFLSLTILLASLFFYRKAMYTALLANSFISLIVLSDPGVTLYLNTFYTEFSAVYFLYLTLIGVVIWSVAQFRFFTAWALAVGLLGLSFSMPQNIPLALCIALLLSVYASIKQQRWNWAPALLLCAAMPLLFQSAGWYAPRNASMVRTNNINFVGSLLPFSNDTNTTLQHLGLPETCKVIAGKTGYDARIQNAHSCPELDVLPTSTKLYALIRQPIAFARLTTNALIQQKNWIFDLYGQVERGRTEPVSHYQRTIGSFLPLAPSWIFIFAPTIVLLLALLLLTGCNKNSNDNSRFIYFLFLLIAIQALSVIGVVLQDGTVSAAKNLHLQFVVSSAVTLLLIVFGVANRKAKSIQ